MDYDKSKYKIWHWHHPFMLHWVLNPGLAFNELILGQRVPKVLFIEKDSSKKLQDKSKIPCPHCGAIHAGTKWSIERNAFKNWFGLYCDSCGKIIPCLTNLTSLILLMLTFPIWIWFKDQWKDNWIKAQPKRYMNLDLENITDSFTGFGWVKQGLIWGLLMFVIISLLLPLIMNGTITTRNIWIGALIWTVGGLCYGYAMKHFIKAI